LDFYDKGKITHHIFTGISSLLPKNSLLVFNDTRVIPARLYFRKPNGVLIEIFLLQPVQPSAIIAEAMNARGETVWECMIGNLKRWRDHQTLSVPVNVNSKSIELTAHLEDTAKNIVKFRWDDPWISFLEMIQIAGKVPLPPYIHREAIEDDKVRYQTIYSKTDGAVASSTAGLHFTGDIMDDLKKAGIKIDFITLHVGAGTFQPIKTKNGKE